MFSLDGNSRLIAGNFPSSLRTDLFTGLPVTTKIPAQPKRPSTVTLSPDAAVFPAQAKTADSAKLIALITAMPKYILWGSYCDNALEKRTPYRQAHLDGLASQKEQGKLITLGPTKDNTKVFGIYEADEADTIRQLIESDPYWQNGIWTEYEIKEWIQAF